MAGNMDTAAHMRFLATVRRQSAPPRCHPFVIVLQVLSLGMVFIGATMTLIAHWPGSTSIGENPLKIAGPVLLAVGLVALVIGIFLVCIVNKRERRRWQKQMADMITSRSNADLVGINDETQLHGNVTSPPGGVYQTQPKDTQPRPISGPVANDPYARPGTGAQLDGNSAGAVVIEGDNVPKPVRVTKPRRTKDRSGEDISMSSTEDLTAPGEGEVAGQVAPKKRRRPKPPAGSQEESELLMSRDQQQQAPAGGDVTAAVAQPSPGEARRLKVHIKAQPGASVRIQNAPPAVAPKPAYRSKPAHPADTSTETDI